MTDQAPRLGCVFLPQNPPERLAATARIADDAGLEELWVWEDCFLAGGISAAAIALSNSRRLTVGIGVAPVPMRNPALTAMEIATLTRAFPGRVRVGLGHGVQDWMAQIGARVDSPMTLLREHLTCIGALLRGETVTFDGRYVQLRDVALDWPPTLDTELLVAAVGPKTLRLSGELGTGTVITQGTSPADLRAAVAHVREGNALRGRGPSSIVTYLLCATGPNAASQMAAEYQRWDLDEAGDVSVQGTAEEIANGLARWTAAGADTLVLQPPVDADIEAFVAFVGRELTPLVN
ncbi:LLM class flavin-dependent oxidoreductase [Mycolicibacterium goodii]|uniref:LLM class flavin-dependent oxidoreductase n=1 Tax=Mycolicibacterium goodii TaxID=134601 RepID=UPI001BDD7817|nr:LLM class flavin-dependent oxidoreductase [Mycolicibacterium goodii]MBU8811412.1 LLM class flavin-dependent oxidoreductase [Mycolicibacterium goodii]MBU8831925.1 LLM class flavin-dependent oxidoreductase [Mycolicibacterium goodii]